QVLNRAGNQFAPFGQAEQRVLAVIERDGDDDSVKEFRGALDDIQVAIGQRVETPRVNRRSHGASLVWCPRNSHRKRARQNGAWTPASAPVANNKKPGATRLPRGQMFRRGDALL